MQKILKIKSFICVEKLHLLADSRAFANHNLIVRLLILNCNRSFMIGITANASTSMPITVGRRARINYRLITIIFTLSIVDERRQLGTISSWV